MKKILIVLLIFIGGLICGYSIQQYMSGDGEASLAGSPAPNTGRGNRAAVSSRETNSETQPPISQILYTQVLPRTTALWAQLDFAQMKERGESIGDFFQDEAIAPVWNDFVSSFPQGVTEVVQHIYDTNHEARFFLMPPAGEKTGSSFLLACKPANIVPDKDEPSMFEVLQQQFPDARTGESQAGDQVIQEIQTPIGELAVTSQSGVTWLCNSSVTLNQLWTQTPPGKTVESAPAYLSLFERYPDSVIAVIVNGDLPDNIPMSAPGSFTQLLIQNNVQQLALLYKLDEGAGRLTVIGPSSNIPDWAKNWNPLDQFAYTESDPVGLLEMAIRWPASTELFSATDAGTLVSEGQNRQNRDRRNRMPDTNTNEIRSEWRERGFGGFAGGDRTGGERPRGDRDGQAQAPREGNRRRGGDPSPFLARLAPPGHTIGINFFGFYDGNPAIVFTLPDLDKRESFINRIEQVPNMKPTPVEVAMLPGSLYHFQDQFMARAAGLNQLLVIDRDAVTYVFDELEIAKNYFHSSASDKNQRDPKIRNFLREVRQPAQIQAILSSDFIQYMISQEIDSLPEEMDYRDDFADFMIQLKSYAQPMAISAGVTEEEWFLDAYSPSQVSHLVNTVFAGLALYRFMVY